MQQRSVSRICDTGYIPLPRSLTRCARSFGCGERYRLTDGAEISDLTFENVHVTVNAAYSGQSLFRIAFLASSVSGTVSLNGLSFQDCTLTLLLPANAAHDIDPGTVYSGVIGVLSDGAQLDYEASGSVTIELPGQS